MTTNHSTPALYTAAEAAGILRVKKSWLERQAAARKIPFPMLGGAYKFTDSHLAAIVHIFEMMPSPSGNARDGRSRSQRFREPAQIKGSGYAPLRPRPRSHPPQTGVIPTKDTSMQTAFTDEATPQEAAGLQDALERGYQKAYQAAREAFSREPWDSGYESRFQTAAECNEVAADVLHETLEHRICRPCESTAEFLSRTRAEAQAAEANRSGFKTPGRWDDVARPHGLSPDVKTFEKDMRMTQQPGAGTDAAATGRTQDDITSVLLADADNKEGRAFAADYDQTAATCARDLGDLARERDGTAAWCPARLTPTRSSPRAAGTSAVMASTPAVPSRNRRHHQSRNWRPEHDHRSPV
jgi:excisionase family DNA binding protein